MAPLVGRPSQLKFQELSDADILRLNLQELSDARMQMSSDAEKFLASAEACLRDLQLCQILLASATSGAESSGATSGATSIHESHDSFASSGPGAEERHRSRATSRSPRRSSHSLDSQRCQQVLTGQHSSAMPQALQHEALESRMPYLRTAVSQFVSTLGNAVDVTVLGPTDRDREDNDN